jgi:hypothetical protein
VVITGTVGFGSALQLSGDGHPFISYLSRDYGNNGLQNNINMAFRDDINWHIEKVYTGTMNLWATSIDLDIFGKAHIGYYDGGYYNEPGPYQLLHAYQGTENWQVEAVDEAGDVGYYVSMASDKNNRVHIAYYDVKNKDLKYAYQTGSGWQTEVVDGPGDVGKYPSLDLDANGYPHVSYVDEKNNKLWYAYRDGSGWHLTNLSVYCPIASPRSLSPLKIDSQGYPHLLCFAYDGNEIYHLYLDASGWHPQLVVITTGTEKDISLVLDKSDRPHISYVSNGFRYAYQDEAGWHKESVDISSTESGNFNSIDLDDHGNPRISYFVDWTSLRFAYRDNLGWHTQIVDTVGSASPASSMELDSFGYAHIVYYDVYGILKYAVQDSTGFHVQILDDRSGGYGNAIALDSLNQPQIAYSGLNNSHLLILMPPEMITYVHLPMIIK